MLTTFFDSEGTIQKELVPPGQRVNAEYYKAVLHHLLKRKAHVKPELYKSSDWFLLHNNAPSHNAAFIHAFLAKKKGVCPSPTPLFPQLGFSHHFLFLQLKSKLKGRRFNDIADIQKNVTGELKRIMEGSTVMHVPVLPSVRLWQ